MQKHRRHYAATRKSTSPKNFLEILDSKFIEYGTSAMELGMADARSGAIAENNHAIIASRCGIPQTYYREFYTRLWRTYIAWFDIARLQMSEENRRFGDVVRWNEAIDAAETKAA